MLTPETFSGVSFWAIENDKDVTKDRNLNTFKMYCKRRKSRVRFPDRNAKNRLYACHCIAGHACPLHLCRRSWLCCSTQGSAIQTGSQLNKITYPTTYASVWSCFCSRCLFSWPQSLKIRRQVLRVLSRNNEEDSLTSLSERAPPAASLSVVSAMVVKALGMTIARFSKRRNKGSVDERPTH